MAIWRWRTGEDGDNLLDSSACRGTPRENDSPRVNGLQPVSERAEITVGLQLWAFSIGYGDDFVPVRMWRVGPDFRPFVCGRDGKPTDRRVGRCRLHLEYIRYSDRLRARADLHRTFERESQRRIGDVIAKALAERERDA